MRFLELNGIKCLGIYVIIRNRTAIFVDEAKYLGLALNDKKFIEAEKQTIKLLERSEKLVNKLMELTMGKEEKEESTEENLEQYDEE